MSRWPMQTPEQNFWEKVDVRGPEDCWEWQPERRDRGGYGKWRLYEHHVTAHRYSYELAHGPIPADMLVCHSCDNPPCVNPAHLHIGSPEQNGLERRERGQYRGERHKSAKLTWATVYEARARRASGERVNALAREYGVHESTMSRAIRGIKWRKRDA